MYVGCSKGSLTLFEEYPGGSTTTPDLAKGFGGFSRSLTHRGRAFSSDMAVVDYM
jgi:hypothetical protein